ncbi:MAG TPA: WD40 repeat domain-containing serine/threonine protein kinase [Verrucomicrobiota bacterium]|nr:WD40 repeat domain-containing serine/threonine protein kinase [Verrucomicrobiota bacterium]
MSIADSPVADRLGPATTQRETTRQRVADYELVSEIARGGMGVVYRAHQLSLNRPVALKLLLAGQFADADQVKRFRTEAEAVARLNHPGIVQIYEVGEFEGRHFFSMRLIEGRSLSAAMNDFGLGATRRRAEEGQTSVSAALRERQRELARFLANVARAVQYAHERGVLHRDLKPANVLVDAEKRPQVTDFGLARVMGDERNLTKTSVVFGTPAYMAPEQTYDPHNVTVAADVYSVGAIGYELVTGQPPFEAGTAVETVIQVREREPTRPRELEPEIERDFETILLKCLAKDPKKRYVSALALAEDLDRYLAGEPILARPVRLPERAWRWSRRHPAIAILSAGLILLVLTVAIVAPLVAIELSFARNRAEEASRRARSDLRDAKLAQARAERLSGEANHRESSLRSIKEAARMRPDRALLNEAIAQLVRFDSGSLNLKPRAGPGKAVALLPDFSTYFLALTNGAIAAFNTTNDQPKWVWPEPAVNQANAELIFPSPDGHHLAIFRSRSLEILKVEGPSLVTRMPAVSFFGFGPDGEWFLVLDDNRQVQRLHTATGRQIETLPFAAAFPGDVAASPASEHPLIAVLGTGQIQLFNWQENRWVGSLKASPGGHLGDVAWGDEWLGCVENGTDIRVWHLPSRRSLILRGHRAPLDRLLFVPGTSLLLSTASDGQSYCWDAASGVQLLTSSEYSPLQVSENGRQLLFGNVETWGWADLAISRSRVRINCLDSGDDKVRDVQFADDGRWVLVTKQAGLHLVDRVSSVRTGFQPAMGAVFAKFVPGTNQVVVVRRQDVCWYEFDPTSGRFISPPIRRYQPPGQPWLDEGTWTPDGSGLILPMTDGVVEFLRVGDGAVVRREQRVELKSATQVDVWGDEVAFCRGSPPGAGRLKLLAGSDAIALADEPAIPRFSPDGQWLLLCGRSSHRVLRTRDWTQAYEGAVSGRIKGLVAPGGWTCDSLFLARAVDRHKIEIYDTQAWQPVLALTTPQPSAFSVLRFSAGCRWLAAGTDQGAVELWDLTALRQEVEPIGLTFEWPVSPEEERMPPTDSEQSVYQALVDLSPPAAAGTFRPRPADATAVHVDLTPFYTAPLHPNWDDEVYRGELPEIPSGLFSANGVRFDVRGIIQLSGGRMKGVNPNLPQAVTNIPVAQLVRRVHFLSHANIAPRSVLRPLEIARVRLNYSDGTSTEFPVRLGEEVEDWWSRPRGPLVPKRASIVWRGISSSSETASSWQQICHFAFDNPHPEIELASIDLVSAMETPSLYVLAITIE